MDAVGTTRYAPLAGLRVLDFGRYIAAPYCASMLADLGAEVIRIESTEGNDDRTVMPVSDDAGALYLHVNQGKLSLPISLRHPDAAELVRRLVESSDVVVANMTVASLRRAGLDYDSLKAIKADIILTNISAFGDEGPEKDSIGFDGTGQAMSGALHLSGTPGNPFRCAVSYVDYGTGLASAFGTLAALHARSRTGEGCEVKASLLGTALTMMNPILIEESLGKRTRKATGNRSPIAGPSDVFKTTDGWVMVQVIGNDMFERWARLVGAEDLVRDPRFVSDIRRGEHGEALSERMATWCRDKSNETCLDLLREARIPGCPVLSPAEALQQSQHLNGGYFRWVDLKDGQGSIPIARPVRFGDSNEAHTTRAPELGQGARGLLTSLGYTDAAIDRLHEIGLVHVAP